METSAMLGFAAGFLTTIAFIPQVVKIYRTRSAEDISLATFGVFSLGVGLWLAYGVVVGEPPIVFWNAVTLLLAAAIVAMKLRFGSARPPRE